MTNKKILQTVVDDATFEAVRVIAKREDRTLSKTVAKLITAQLKAIGFKEVKRA